MGQDRVRPLALALQGLDYTIKGQTERGGRGREGACGGDRSVLGEYVAVKEERIERVQFM